MCLDYVSGPGGDRQMEGIQRRVKIDGLLAPVDRGLSGYPLCYDPAQLQVCDT